LIEACSDSLPDILFAEEVAGLEVTNYGGGEISNSWGVAEAAVGNPADGGGTLTEVEDDNYFYRYYWRHVTYFASAGDGSAQVLYPSASPWVISAGGTTVNRDASGNFLSESCWPEAGGGPSTVETWQSPPDIHNGMGPWSNYQYGLFGGNTTSYRNTPDVSFDADPDSGVYVYDTDGGGAWYIVGGTSVSSPALAGIVNSAEQKLGMVGPVLSGQSFQYYQASELNLLYAQLETHEAYEQNFYDVTTGSNGYAAAPGYDNCTGIGSPRGLKGK